MTAYTEVLFDELEGQDGHLGIITLDRPAALNSLNHDMIVAIHSRLMKWAENDDIKAVVIKAAEGRAFCAGGDIRLAYERARANDPLMAEFFRDEYQLNRYIFHYPKPYIALLDGITMGGGVGVSIHGSHRVATDRLLFAMPETGIGFFPDVGGTYFLPRLPGKLGLYLGLTGARIKCDDAIALGLATHKVKQADLSALVTALAETVFSNDANNSVTQVINQFTVAAEKSLYLQQQKEIDAAFAAATMEDILQAVQHSSASLCQEAATVLAKKSPTSLKVTLHALAEGKNMDFDACMRQEFRLTCRFLKEHDFPEGIRAVIIDKDQKPVWKPATLQEVTADQVEKYFAPMLETKELA
jgi:enoyl-CoA hydratase